MTADSPKSNLLCTTHVKVDSAANRLYWRQQDQSCLGDMQQKTVIKVSLPNASCMTSTSQVQLHISNELSHAVKKAIILPKLQSSSLVSLG